MSERTEFSFLTDHFRDALEQWSKQKGLIKKSLKPPVIPPGSKYPLPVLESVWKKWKKPSRKTLGGLLRRNDQPASWGEMHRRISGYRLSAKLDDLIEFAFADEFAAEAGKETGKELLKNAVSKLLLAKKQAAGVNNPTTTSTSDLSAVLDVLIQFQDPRPRSPTTGEFQPQGEGGPSPNAMARVYKTPQSKPRSSLLTGAGAALAGGALGAIGEHLGKAAWAGSRNAIKALAAKRKGIPQK